SQPTVVSRGRPEFRRSAVPTLERRGPCRIRLARTPSVPGPLQRPAAIKARRSHRRGDGHRHTGARIRRLLDLTAVRAAPRNSPPTLAAALQRAAHPRRHRPGRDPHADGPTGPVPATATAGPDAP